MFRLLGFLFGVALAIIVLAAIIFSPVRERAAVLATEITGDFFDQADELNPEQSDTMSKAAVVPVVAQDKQKQADEAPIKEEAEAATPGLARNSTLPHEDSTIATQALAAAQPVTQENEVVPMQPAAGVQKIVSAAPSVQQEMGSAGPAAAADRNETNGELIAWQPVWRAFRSELSAKGFADQLQRLTGQEYRVRRTSAWSYQVELAYVDERQRDSLLHEIQTKTGLVLVEVQP